MNFIVIKSFIKIMRPHQYYKNSLIGICLVFAGELFNISSYLKLTIGFVVLCFISSSGYIINDILDIEKDKKHPDKKSRPLPSGELSKFQALTGLIILNLIVLSSTFIVSSEFILFSYSLFISTFIYSFYAKNKPILDLMFVSINYVIRAVAGCIIIDEVISPWLLVCGFLFALFLVTGKRYGDLMILGEEIINHKPVFEYYNEDFLKIILVIATSTLVLSYAIYVIQTEYLILVFSLPVFVYFIFSYLLVVLRTDEGKKPHKVLTRKEIIVSLLLLAIMAVLSIYFEDNILVLS